MRKRKTRGAVEINAASDSAREIMKSTKLTDEEVP